MIELNIMYDYLIVDGYNVLHYALSKGLLEIKSMEGARRWLLDQLVNYTYHQGIRTLLYFDARDSGTPEGYVEDFGRLRMIFPLPIFPQMMPLRGYAGNSAASTRFRWLLRMDFCRRSSLEKVYTGFPQGN